MSEFKYGVSQYVPFGDRKVCERIRKIDRADICKHPNPDLHIRVVKDNEIFYCPAQKNELLRKHRRNEEEGAWTWETPNGNEARPISYHYGLMAQIRLAPELETRSLKLAAIKNEALVSDAFMPFGEGSVWAHPQGLTTGFAAGHAGFKVVDRQVKDLAAEMATLNIDRKDLFAAAMFKYLGNNTGVMNKYFLRSQ